MWKINMEKNNLLLKNKIAIVVGGSGLIGANTIKALLNSGCEVINVDLYDSLKINKN